MNTRPIHASVCKGPVSVRTVLAGFCYIWTKKLILGSISLDMVAVLLGGAVALLPIYAREILRTGPWGLGLLRSAPSVGAALMAIVVAHWPIRRRAGITLLLSVAGFGILTIVLAVSRSLTVSLAALFLLGASDMVSVIIRTTLVQVATPFESGLTAKWFGTVPAVGLGGIGTRLVIPIWTWLFPELRAADRSTATEFVAEEELRGN